jgi:hypothetical protein
MIFRRKTKNVSSSFLLNSIFRHYVNIQNSEVNKWCHGVKTVVDLEKPPERLSFEVLHDIDPPILRFGVRVKHFRPKALILNIKADRLPKLISWALDEFLLSQQVWSSLDQSYSKNKGFVDRLLELTIKWPWPWPLTLVTLMNWLSLKCREEVRLFERENCLRKIKKNVK